MGHSEEDIIALGSPDIKRFVMSVISTFSQVINVDCNGILFFIRMQLPCQPYGDLLA